MLNIAETVLFRLPYPVHWGISGKRTLHKGDSIWDRGIWCGRSEDTGEHILLTTDGRVMARTVRRLPAGSGADITLLRESIGTPWDPMPGTVTENNIPMPALEVFHREVVPPAQEVDTPTVKTHTEDQTVEQKQKREHERTKNFPAEASASSTGPSASGHDADVPMTDDETRGRAVGLASDGEREPVFVNPIQTSIPARCLAHLSVAQWMLHFEPPHDVLHARALQTFWVQTAPTQKCAKHPHGSGAVRRFHRSISRSRRAPHSVLSRRAEDPQVRVAAAL